MKYISILGKGYKDCKAKLDSIKREPGVNYGLVTKLKHTAGVPISGVIETELAKLNPEYREIMAAVKGKKITPELIAVVPAPVVVAPEPVVVAPEPVVVDEPEPVVVDEPEVVNEVAEEDIKDLMEEVKESGILDTMFEKHQDKLEEDIEDAPVDIPIANHIDELLEEVSETEPIEEEVPEPEPVVEEVVEPEPEVVIPELVVPELVVPEPQDIKPVNAPRGWHARKEFIDSEGNIFNKGQYVGNEND